MKLLPDKSSKPPSKPKKGPGKVSTQFKPGNPGGPGRKPGTTPHLNDAQVKFLQDTGLTPLQFFSNVYRDQLYDKYTIKKMRNRRGDIVFVPMPADDAKKLTTTLAHRLYAANAAGPYMHRKMPIAIEGMGSTLLTPDMLAKLSTEELRSMYAIMQKLNVAGMQMPTGSVIENEPTDLTDAEPVEDEEEQGA